MIKKGDLKMKNFFTIALVIVLTLIYAIIRYNVFGNVPFSDIPTFILNKSIAFSIVIILALSLYQRIKGKNDDANFLIGCLPVLATIHVLLSISLLSQNYYAKLYSDNKLTLLGGLAVLVGVLTFVYFIFNKSKISPLFMYVLLSLHVAFIGVKNWFDVSKWLGSMPPITLICFIILLLLFVITIVKTSKKSF